MSLRKGFSTFGKRLTFTRNAATARVLLGLGDAALLNGSDFNYAITVNTTPPSPPSEGDLWFDTSTNTLMVFYNGQWVNASPGSRTTTSTEQPTSPAQGDIWYNVTDGRLQIFYNGQWIDASPAPTPTVIGETPPADPSPGDLWWKSDEGRLKIYYDDGDSQQWVDAHPVPVPNEAAAAPPYIFGFWLPKWTDAADRVIGQHIAGDAFTLAANMAGSIAAVETNPAASFAIDVQRQVAGSGAFASIGTITVATNGAISFATTGGASVAVAAGDVLKFVAPAAADASIAYLSISIRGDR